MEMTQDDTGTASKQLRVGFWAAMVMLVLGVAYWTLSVKQSEAVNIFPASGCLLVGLVSYCATLTFALIAEVIAGLTSGLLDRVARTLALLWVPGLAYYNICIFLQRGTHTMVSPLAGHILSILLVYTMAGTPVVGLGAVVLHCFGPRNSREGFKPFAPGTGRR